MLEEKEIKLPLDVNVSVEKGKGLVIIGANGSGKTQLGIWLSQHTDNKKLACRISAQKSLTFPGQITLKDYKTAQNELKRQDEHPSSNGRLNDFQQLVNFLFSEHNEQADIYREYSKGSANKVDVSPTTLEKTISILEDILPHRSLIKEKGVIKTRLKNSDSEPYEAEYMSDGERVIFYLVGKCLSAEKNGIIIVDEPEMHLHKAIQNILWDKIEQERNDCIFIYMTHDATFSASRIGFKKFWLRGFNGSKDWQIELINTGDIPEELLLELYGNRRKVLLVEGSASSLEAKLYQNVFENFLIKPCGGCEQVISYVRALKKNIQFHHENVYGLIDRDRRNDEEIASLEEDGIFALEVAEFENLFVVPELLEFMSNKRALDPAEQINKVKQGVFEKLTEELDTQAKEHAIEEIKWRLNGLDLSKLKTVSLNDFVSSEIDQDKINTKWLGLFKNLISKQDYKELLKVYNRKSIHIIASSNFIFGKNEFRDSIIRYSDCKKDRKEIKSAILKYLPNGLVNIINT